MTYNVCYCRTVKKILALDANGVDDLHYKEETALHLAAMKGHADVIRLLVIDVSTIF